VKEHLSGKDGLQDMMDNFRRFMSGEGRKVGGVPHFYIYSDPAKKYLAIDCHHLLKG